jgi:hypothetical protein
MLISQQLRPNDLVRFRTPHVALAPIAGLQMTQGAVEAGHLLLVRCNRAEWETAERAYVFKDWHSQYYEANPVFIVRQYDPPFAAEDIQPALENLQSAGRRLVTALRLQKPGHVLEPAYTARFVVTDGFTVRQLGPYRTEYLAMPLDRLTWVIEEGDTDVIGRLVATIEAVESIRNTEGLLATIDQFNLAHTPLVSISLAVHLLLTALSMVFADEGASGPRAAPPMYERALLIMRWASPHHLDPAIESFYRDRVQPLRNVVHHHALAEHDVNLGEAKEMLAWSLRLGIRLLMQAHVKRLAHDPTTPRQILNQALDRFGSGDPSGLDAIVGSAAG